MKGREESDGLIVPEGRRKAVPTEGVSPRGGKGTTVSQQARQLELFSEPADSPKGTDDVEVADRSAAETIAVPLSGNTERTVAPAMVIEEVARYGNLLKAFKKVAANDGSPGPDRKSIKWVRERLQKILPHLQRELLNGKYRPGMIRRAWIPKQPDGRRPLGIPDVIDRLVQAAFVIVMTPHYEPGFHPSSHGFIRGRSCHTAIAEATKYLEEGHVIVVDIDLKSFFDRVNHDRLMSRLGQKIRDERMLKLIRRMLKAKIVLEDGVIVSNDEGVPQGGPLSPLLSNIVLDELDWELDRRGHRFVRYADDCNIYVRSERSGHRVMASISRYLERRLRLEVNEKKSAVGKPEERHFLGFHMWRDPETGRAEVLLSRRSRDRINRRIRELTPRNWGKSIEDCILGINSYLSGWAGFFRIVTEAEERTLNNLDAHIRRRLRAMILKQWKRKRTIVRRLVALGVKQKTAKRHIYGRRRSWWAMSCCYPVNQGLNNRFIANLGLFSIVGLVGAAKFRDAIVPVQLSLPLG